MKSVTENMTSANVSHLRRVLSTSQASPPDRKHVRVHSESLSNSAGVALAQSPPLIDVIMTDIGAPPAAVFIDC